MSETEISRGDYQKPSPEPALRVIYPSRCSEHRFNFVSMPRDVRGDDQGFVAKCPLRVCLQGIRKN